MSRKSTDQRTGTVSLVGWLWERNGANKETSLELVPQPTQNSQTPPWMTVRPQHHRRPLPRRRRRHLLYNLPHLISLLSLLFRPRHRHKTETVPSTLSVQCRRPSAVCTAPPATVVLVSSTRSCRCLFLRVRGSNGNTRRPPQLSRQPALRSPDFQYSPPSSSSPCHRSSSPLTPTTMTQPDIPLSRISISLAVARYGP
jgi:hypothetical protein